MYEVAATGVSAGSVVLSLVLYVIYAIGMWKVVSKAGYPGWMGIIPIVNIYVMFKISWGNGWLFLLLLIPIVNIVIMIIMYYKLSKSFGQPGVFTLGLIFLSMIFICILGFGNAQYQGPYRG